MAWNLKNEQTIYKQLLEQIEILIITGIYSPGSKLPSVRDLAAEAAVNPNTMQKALSELERSQLVYSQRTTGRYVTEDINMIQQVKEKLAKEQILEFFKQMNKLEIQPSETLELIRISIKEAESWHLS